MLQTATLHTKDRQHTCFTANSKLPTDWRSSRHTTAEADHVGLKWPYNDFNKWVIVAGMQRTSVMAVDAA